MLKTLLCFCKNFFNLNLLLFRLKGNTRYQDLKQDFAIRELQNVSGKLRIEITNWVDNCESTFFWWLNSFSGQIILLAFHSPSTSTPTPNKHFLGVHELVTTGIPFTKRHYLSIWGLILCLLCLRIIYHFNFIPQYCINVQFSFFSFPWNIALNSFIMRLPGEHTITRKCEIIFASLSQKSPTSQHPPLRAYSASRDPHLTSDKI